MGPDRVDIWATDLSRVDHAARVGRYGSLLAPGERQRAVRFIRQQDRWRYTTTRALVRTALAEYMSAPPESLRFGRTPAGCPFLMPHGTGGAPPRFSVSHTDWHAFVAVTWQRRLGFDAEPASRQVDPLLVRRFFTAAETQYVLQSPAHTAQRILEIWTLKEAYVKGLGLGMRIHPASFGFAAFAANGVAEKVVSLRQGQTSAWRFFELGLPGDHLGAFCLEHADLGTEPAVRLFARIPLGGTWQMPQPQIQEVCCETAVHRRQGDAATRCARSATGSNTAMPAAGAARRGDNVSLVFPSCP